MPHENSFIEKRVHPRVPIKMPIKYRVIEDQRDVNTASKRKEELTSQTKDVSLGGLFMIADQVHNTGSILRLNISIPEITNEIVAFAEVVWSNNTGAGLHFESIKEEDVDVLKNFLSLKSLKYKPT